MVEDDKIGSESIFTLIDKKSEWLMKRKKTIQEMQRTNGITGKAKSKAKAKPKPDAKPGDGSQDRG